MRKPGGYAVWTDADGQVKETDTFTCHHCQFVVFVPARTDPANLGGLCKQCMGLICPTCVAKGICTPFEKALEQMEARGRFLRSAGLGVLLLSLWTATAGAQPITVAGRARTREITTDRVLVECGQGGYGLQFRLEGIYELTKGATPRSWRAQKLRPLPPELDPLVPPADRAAPDIAVAPVAVVAADATVVHRVLFVTTPRTEQAFGGFDNMLSALVAVITATNLTYANANLNLRAEMADLMRVTYTETTITTDLTHDSLVGGRPGLVVNPFAVVALQMFDSWRGGAQQ